MKDFFTLSWLSFKSRRTMFNIEEFLCYETLYPLLTLAFYCILAGYSYQTTNLTRWVVGNSFLLCVNTCIFTLGSTFMAERAYGCVKSLIVSPAHMLGIILHKSFFTCLVAMATVVLGFIAGGLLFSVDYSEMNWFLFLLAVIVAMFAATGFGMFIGIFGLISDQMHFVLNFMSYVLMIFCGANFPVSQLPLSARIISEFLPLTHSIKAVNMLFDNLENYQFPMLLLQEAGVGVLFFLLSSFLISLIEKISVKKGASEVF